MNLRNIPTDGSVRLVLTESMGKPGNPTDYFPYGTVTYVFYSLDCMQEFIFIDK